MSYNASSSSYEIILWSESGGISAWILVLMENKGNMGRALFCIQVDSRCSLLAVCLWYLLLVLISKMSNVEFLQLQGLFWPSNNLRTCLKIIQRPDRLFMACRLPEWLGYHVYSSLRVLLQHPHLCARALQNAIDHCNNPNDATGSGNTSACNFLNVTLATTANLCKTNATVDEVIDGRLIKLPG